MNKLFEKLGGRKEFNILLFVSVVCVNAWFIGSRTLTDNELMIIGGVLVGTGALNVIQKFKNNGKPKEVEETKK